MTCSDIVTLALRLAGVIGLNATPTASEAANGLTLLQGLYEGWATGGMLGSLTDVLTAVDYTANERERVRATDGATVTLPTEITDRGTTRAPRDLTLIEIYDVDAAAHSLNLWDRNAWVTLNDLTLTDDAPLAKRGRDGLAACLAEAYVDMFGGSLAAGTALRGSNFKASISSKRGTTQDRPPQDYY